jgi:Cu(I)/Ag(I) efflux system membrane protein CusA/SilA
MIARLIRWSATNLMLILIGVVLRDRARHLCVAKVPLDAIPDLSDTQVIVYTEYPGQAPQVVEDQVTYPLTTAMLSVPRSKVVRGFSFFGVSFVYVIFEDGTDIYWARSRVLEYLNSAPQSAERRHADARARRDRRRLGLPVCCDGAKRTLAELRTTQDWQSASPSPRPKASPRSRASAASSSNTTSSSIRAAAGYDIPLTKSAIAIRASNMDVGGRVVELAETEFMVRGRGYLRSIADIEQIVLKAEGPTPVLLRDVARVELAPDERRGVTELNGEGEVVSGIAVQRLARTRSTSSTTSRPRSPTSSSLPEGTEIEPVYDRSDLIHRAIDTLKTTLIEESIIVALVCFVFLLHVRSALVAIITLPLGILIAYHLHARARLSSNIMSLGGIAIAIGAMIDAAIVMIENAHKHLERAPARQAAHRGDHRGGERSWAGAVLLAADHHRLVPADLRAGSAGRAAVQAARLHQDLRHGGGGVAVGHARAGADGAVRARAHRARSTRIR